MSPVREAATEWFTEEPGRETMARGLARELGFTDSGVYRVLRAMAAEGLLSCTTRRVHLKGCAALQNTYSATDKLKPRPIVPSVSIVDSALANRGALLQAWWPLNYTERRAA